MPTKFTQCLSWIPDEPFQRREVFSCYTCKFDDMMDNIARFSCEYDESKQLDNEKLVVQESEDSKVFQSTRRGGEVLDPLDTLNIGVSRITRDELDKMVIEIDTDLFDDGLEDYDSVESFIDDNTDTVEAILKDILERINFQNISFYEP